MRVIGLDVGDRRIGVAVSDPLGVTAQGLETLDRRIGFENLHKRIQDLISEYKPDKIVLGLPRNMNGTYGPQSDKVKEFGSIISKYYTGNVLYWDERLTTVSAHKVMIDADVSRAKRKTRVDKLAAVLILQNYLDYSKDKT